MYDRSDTLRIAVIDGEVVDDSTRVLRLLPPVPPARHPESRLARRARIFRMSPFARHLAATATAIVDGTWFLLWTVAAGIGLAALFVGFGDMADSLFRALGR